MTKKKKLIWIFTAILLVLAITAGIIALAVSCKKEDETDDTPPVKEPVLNKTDVALEIFERVQLKVLYWDGETVWTSANESVVTVDEKGMLCGISEGNTQVTADIGETEFVCEITVFPSDNVPMVFVKGVDSIDLLPNDSFTVQPFVSYGGAEYDNATYSFKIYDTTVASVTADGTVTGLKVGETLLEISAQWETYVDDIRLKTVLPVIVKENINARIFGEAQLNLYTYALTAYSQTFNNETQLSAIVEDNGEVAASEFVSWHSSDETVATVDVNGVVRAVGAGNAEITVRYENGEKACVSNAVQINVLKPVVDITKKLPVVINCWLDENKTTIEYDLRTLFLDSQTPVTEITDEEGNAIAYANGVFENTLEKGDFVWTIANENYAVKTRAFCATKIITTAAELSAIETFGNQTFEERTVGEGDDATTYKITHYTGYFALGNDIAFTSSDAVVQWKDPSQTTLLKTAMHMGSTQYTDVGFSGVFEGMGHTVSNVRLGRGGLFGSISENGEVRNFNVENAALTANSASVIALNLSGRVENVKISVNQNECKISSPLAYLAYNATFKNVHITTENAVREDGGCAAVVYWTKGGCTVENVSVNAVTGAKLVYSDQANAYDLITVRLNNVDESENDVNGDDQIWG